MSENKSPIKKDWNGDDEWWLDVLRDIQISLEELLRRVENLERK